MKQTVSYVEIKVKTSLNKAEHAVQSYAAGKAILLHLAILSKPD